MSWPWPGLVWAAWLRAGTHQTKQAPDHAYDHERQPILLIESDTNLGRALVDQLAADGYHTELARSISDARFLVAVCPPRLLLLGELDPPRGALDLLEDIRSGSSEDPQKQADSPWPPEVPVIVLGSRGSQPDLLRAFESGADDFLAHPVRYLELRARLRAVLRRSQHRSDDDRPLTIGPLTIDRASHTVCLHGTQFQLRRREYELLLQLASDPQRVFRKQELLRAVWGYQANVPTRTLDSHASRLRRELQDRGESWVINVWGVGCRLK
jgi:DNA-binding response OmpR family regulator